MLPGASSYIFNLADNFVSNGVVHRLDYVMTPPSLPSAGASVTAVNVPAGSAPYPTSSVFVTSYTSKPTGVAINGVKSNHEFFVGSAAVLAGLMGVLL